MNVSKTHTTNASLKCLFLTITIISIALLSYPAKAETGSVTVSNETRANWSTNDLGLFTLMSIRQVDNMTQFAFDTGNFTSVSNYTIWDFTGELSYAYPNEVTTFTITANGTGHGSATYSSFLRRLQWVFSSDTVITGSPFNVTYSSNIFQNVTSSGVPATNGWDFVAANSLAPPQWNHTTNSMPMYVFNSTGSGASFIGRTLQGYDKAPNTRRLILSGTFSSGVVTNFYTITYPNEGFYLADITKTGQNVSTKDILHTQTNDSYGYYTEANFNTNNFQVLMPQLDGIYLNVTIGTGDFHDVLINASGSTVVTPTPTPTPPQAGATGAALSWSASSYNVNDVGTLTGNVTISPPLFGDIRVIISNSSSQQAFYVWDSSGTFPQTASYLYSFPSADIYTGKLISHSPFSGDEELANATTQVVTPISYIFAPANAVTGQNITVSYKFNPVPSGGAIEDVIAPEAGGYGTYINSTLCPCNSATNSIKYVINGEGTHTLRLWDTTNLTIVATTTVHVSASGGIVYGNITNNALYLDGTQYRIGDVINAQYQISSANWSNYNYFKAALVSSGNVTMGNPVQLQQEAGTFQIGVTGGQFGIIQGGAGNVTITAGSSAISANTVMASVPVTIVVDKNGYSLSTNPVTICRNTPEVVKYTSPTGAGILQELYSTPSGTTKINNYSFSSNGTRTFVYNDGTVKNNGGIIYSVLSASGGFEVNSIVKYQFSGCTAPGVTAAPGETPPQTGTGQASALITLITSNIFWALIITVGLMIFVAWRTKDGFPTATVGFLVGGIFTFLGWLPAWIFFSLFIIAALLVASSIVEKQIKNVTK